MKTLFQTSLAVRSNDGLCLPAGVTELDDEQARLWLGGWEETTDAEIETEAGTEVEGLKWVDPFVDYPELLEEIVEIMIVTGEVPLEWEFEVLMYNLANDDILDIFLDP